MWRAHTSRQGRQVLNAAKKQFTTESGQVKPTPPPLPKPATGPPRRSFGLLKFIGLTLPVAGGGLVGYSWYDPDFRKQLEENVPYAKDLLENILPASETAFPAAKQINEPAPDVGTLPPPIFESAKVEERPKSIERKVEEKVLEEQILPLQSMQYSNWVMTAKCSVEDEPDFQSEKFGENCFSYCYPTMDRENKNKVKGVKKMGFENLANETSISRDHNDQMENTYLLTAEVERILQKKLRPDIPEDFELTKYLSYPTVSYLGHNPDKCFQEQIEETKSDPSPSQAPHPSLQSSKKPEETLEDIAEAMKSKEEIENAENVALEVVLQKLLTRSETIIEETVKAQMNVVNHTRAHVKLLKNAMDDSQEILNKDDQWKAVAVAFKEKENAAIRSAELVSESKKSIENIQEVLTSSKQNPVTKTNPAIYPATKKVVELTNAIGTANAQVRQAESEARVMLKYKDLVDKGKKQFQQELESLMPEVKMGSTSKKLSEDELNALIAHAHRRIEQLQRQLAEQMSMERQRLTRALEAQRNEGNQITLAAVADEQLRLQNEYASEKHKLDLDFLIRQEEEVRKQLGRQAAAHSDHIKDVLSVQREQLSVDFNRELNAKILEERENFQTEVSSWISRLKGIESAVDARAQSEHLARCAQNLWLACIALSSVIDYGKEETPESLIPIQREVDAILKVGNKHPFVETVALTLPKAALERGIYTEEQLRNRFVKVSKVCRRLGLITESNASLYQYLVSVLHSLVVFDSVVALTPTDQIDLNSLDNFGLVAHAQHFMSQGDLESALRFMCQLTGESKVAASDWVTEAKLLIATRQAATSLTAYASATGLANTF